MTTRVAIEQLVKNYPGFSLGPIDMTLEAGMAARSLSRRLIARSLIPETLPTACFDLHLRCPVISLPGLPAR